MGRILICLFMILSAVACSGSSNGDVWLSPGTLDSSVQEVYRQGKPILLFAYDDNIESLETSEGYADWAAYLNDFKSSDGAHFHIQRVESQGLSGPVLGNIASKTFSLFIKRGMPSYFYEGAIVEPEVYTVVASVYRNAPLPPGLEAYVPAQLDGH